MRAWLLAESLEYLDDQPSSLSCGSKIGAFAQAAEFMADRPESIDRLDSHGSDEVAVGSSPGLGVANGLSYILRSGLRYAG